jgi:hypothetical protein
VHTYSVVLFIHLLSLLLAIGAAAVMIVCAFGLRRARTLEQALPWALLAKATPPRTFPLAVLGLYGTGAYMTSDSWTWGTGWIDVSIVGLAVVAIEGPLIGGRAGAAIGKALQENGPGPLGPAARHAIEAVGHWVVTFASPALVLGIIWNMTQKPGTGGAVAAVVIAYAAGAALGLRFTRAPAVEAEAVADTAS